MPSLEELARRWNDIEPLLKKATVLSCGCYEPIDVFQLAMRGQVTIWLAGREGCIDGVIVTEVRQFPRRRVLDITLLGGRRMSEWLPLLVRTLDGYALNCDCTAVTGWGRKGWSRAWGAEERATFMIRELR